MKSDSNGSDEIKTIGGISFPFPTYETLSLLQKMIGFIPSDAVDSFGETALAFAVLSRPVSMAKLLVELERCHEENSLVLAALQCQIDKSRAALVAWNRSEILEFNRWLLQHIVRQSGAPESAVVAALEAFDARIEK